MFDTYKTCEAFDKFIKERNEDHDDFIPNGFIVAAACQDDCVKNMSEEAKMWFAMMGSKEIHKLEYR